MTANGGSELAVADLFLSGDFYWDVVNRVRTPANELLNAQLKWTLPGDMMSFTGFGSHRINTLIYRTVTSSGPGDVAVYIDPWMYSVRASFKF